LTRFDQTGSQRRGGSTSFDGSSGSLTTGGELGIADSVSAYFGAFHPPAHKGEIRNRI
jgi:hypothetical protein